MPTNMNITQRARQINSSFLIASLSSGGMAAVDRGWGSLPVPDDHRAASSANRENRDNPRFAGTIPYLAFSIVCGLSLAGGAIGGRLRGRSPRGHVNHLSRPGIVELFAGFLLDSLGIVLELDNFIRILLI